MVASRGWSGRELEAAQCSCCDVKLCERVEHTECSLRHTAESSVIYCIYHPPLVLALAAFCRTRLARAFARFFSTALSSIPSAFSSASARTSASVSASAS